MSEHDRNEDIREKILHTDARVTFIESDLKGLGAGVLRIENKLDGMADALYKLVAVETTQQHMNERLNRLEQRQDSADERVRAVSHAEAVSSSGSAMFERLVIILISSAIAVLAGYWIQ